MNVIFLSLESTRSDYFGPESPLDTPAIDRICEEGEHFPDTFVQMPHTGNHGSILTGKLPKNSGIRSLGGALKDEEMETVFSFFDQNGFEVRTLLGSGMLKDRGFRGWSYAGSDEISNVEGAIQETREDDLFLFIHYWNTHLPYRTRLPVSGMRDFFANVALRIQQKLFPRGYMGRYNRPFWKEILRYPIKYFWNYRMERIRDLIEEYPERVERGYRESLKEADEYIEEMIRILEDEDALEDTLIVVFGDHGESFNEHQERQEEKRYEHGNFLYDNVLNVPLVLWSRDDSLLESGEKWDRLARSIDILPTALSACDLDFDQESFDGVDLFESSPEYAYAEVNTDERQKAALRSREYKLIRDFRKDEDRFYDIEEDPGETDDISEEEPDRIEKFSQVLQDFRGKVEADEEEEIKSRLRNLGYRD